MSKQLFKKQLLATSVAVAVSAAATAQETQKLDETYAGEEEVLVTGFRASLERAMDIKRNSSGVVDSISSEDMGKFPDTNLAESLQRITGVSIDRSNGEGQKVTVRGLGPDFNLVTLNGRQMPTSGLEATTVNGGRSFDFANIASEGISGVDVYKTAHAGVASGGMGATIDVRTTRPLDAPGLKFSIGTKGVYDESSVDPEFTPELSAIYSQTFAEDKVGVAVSFSRQERQGGFRQVNVPDGWHTQSTQQVDGWFGGMDLTSGEIGTEDFFLRPQNVEYNFTEFERDRTNGQLTLQFKPVDELEVTLDYTYSEQEIASNTNTLNVWFWEGEQVNEVDSEWALGGANASEGGNVYYPVVFSHRGGEDLVFGVGDFAQVNQNDSFGLNVEWQASDSLTLSLDYHDSTAESKADSPYGNSSVIQVASFTREGATVDFSQDFAVTGAREPAADGSGYIGASAATQDTLQPTGSSLRNSVFNNDIKQLQLTGKYEFDNSPIKSVDFGVGHMENDVQRGLMVAQRDNWGGNVGTADDLRDEVFTARSVLDDFESANATGNLANGAGTFDQFDLYYRFDFAEHAQDIVNTQSPSVTGDPVDPAVWPCADRFCVTDVYTTNQIHTETTTSAFVEADFEFELGFGVLSALLGVRYEETEVESGAIYPVFSRVDWVAANEFSLVDSGERTSETFDESYDYFLPSLDLALDLENDMVIRASVSQSISRANYNDVVGGYSLGTIRNLGGDATRGNPGLLPHESTNVDLSYEWYFGDASYVSVGAFYKKVENFVGDGEVEESIFDLRNPSQGPRFAAAVDALGSDATTGEIRDYIIANYPDTVDGARIQSTSDDPLLDWTVSVPVNEDTAEISGFEFALQHAFESGFGAQVNYTIVDSTAEYDPTIFEQQFALLGLSDTFNLIGFYETEKFQVRLAYNWRDAFLTNSNRNHGNPEFVDDYSQWDLSASYSVTDQISVFAEGINITDETTRSYSRYEGALQSATELGPRYNVGARYTF